MLQHFKSSLGTLAAHIGMLVSIPAAPLLSQLPARGRWEDSVRWSGDWVPAAHIDDPDGVLTCWLQPDYCRHLIGGRNLWREDFCSAVQAGQIKYALKRQRQALISMHKRDRKDH